MYTNKQYEIIEKMMQEFSLVEPYKKTEQQASWYDLASGIKNLPITLAILKDMNRI